jgi:glycosyl-4,4'-diaponeurosporenoate acyltransferase
VPLVRVGTAALLAVNVAAWAAIHALSGYAVHKLPPSRLARDGWLFRPRPFERDGRFYADRLRIKRWKDRLPEAGALFAGGVSKRHLPVDGDLARFAVETRRAELGHWLATVPAPLFVLWNPPGIAAAMVFYALVVNLPFIAIQRYNRCRIGRLLRSSTPRSPTAAAERSARGTNGASIPYGSPP